MPGTVSNLQHRPVWACFGAIGSAVTLGFSEEGATIDFNEGMVEQMAVQTGQRPLEAYYNPGGVVVTLSLSEIASFTIMDEVFPFGQKQLDEATPPANRFVSDKLTTGITTQFAAQKMSTVAGLLRLVPVDEYVDADTETDNQFWLISAYPANMGQWNLALEEGLAPTVEFHSLYVAGAGTAGEFDFHWGVGYTNTGVTGSWSAA